MSIQNHIVIYSHGFGVRKDDRGLFTDIAVALPDVQHIMFDYSQVDEATGNLTVKPLTEQTEKLGKVIVDTQANNPDATIDLVCHSQGCVVAALLRPKGIRKIILTAPPAELSVDDMVRIFVNRQGSEVNLNGTSLLKRADFSATKVPPTYWKSIENIDPVALYNDLARVTQLVVINGAEDEIVGSKDFSGLTKELRVTEIKTGHNFEGSGRQELIKAITQLVVTKPPVIIVNENDEIIGYKERGTLAIKDIYRVSALWLTNSNGDILLAQRKFTKKHDPGKWGPAVAGTVDKGETYESNIIKEAEEEIGLKDIKTTTGPKRRVGDGHNYFCRWYLLTVDKLAEDFKIQENEVEQVRWFTRAELKAELREHPENYLSGISWCLMEFA